MITSEERRIPLAPSKRPVRTISSIRIVNRSPLNIIFLAVLTAIALVFTTLVQADCGDEAQSTASSRRFVINKGEVHDRKTGLIWKRCAVGRFEYIYDRCDGFDDNFPILLSWEKAQQAAKAAGPAWRLPTKVELESIVSSNCRNPSIDESMFPDTDNIWFWTSTVSEDGGVWQVFFGDGHSDHLDREASPSALRLVRKAK